MTIISLENQKEKKHLKIVSQLISLCEKDNNWEPLVKYNNIKLKIQYSGLENEKQNFSN